LSTIVAVQGNLYRCVSWGSFLSDERKRIMRNRFFPIVTLALLSVAFFTMGLFTVLAQDEPADPLGEPGTFLTGYYDAWVNSPHARFEDEAFVHWDGDEEQVVPESCAACHSTPGYIDFLGADGSEAGVVDAPAPLGTVVNCNACHNPVASHMSSVTFPSGVELTDLDDSSRCMVCHQGRASSVTVSTAIENAGLLEEPNTVSEDLRFVNIHYYAAASTLYGSEVSGGYEFEGKAYFGRNEHVENYDTCAGCHNPHTLEVKVNACSTCHEGVESVEDLTAIRMPGSMVDFDGDGDMEEGMAGEIETLHGMLYEAMQLYAAEVVGTPIGYESHSYPYFFQDSNGDGEISEDEAIRDNGYNTFTPLLLQATYNYQVVAKDPGDYAHNPRYHIQLMYDTIEALNAELGGEGVDLASASRDGRGHFAFSAEAFRHWDADGEVEAGCTKCHTAEGLPFFLEHDTTIGFEPSSSLACSTCHDPASEEFALYPVTEVGFPSGAVVSFDEESPSNMCLNCHQGRESTVSVNAAINRAGVGDDEVSEALSFRNPHYFSAGATWFGTEVQGAYEFEGMEYNSAYEHTRQYNECTDCHTSHTLEVRFDECTECHVNVESADDVLMIRASEEDAVPFDYDGDGDTSEPIRDEIATFEAALLAEILDYANNTVGTPIAYEPHAYPYFFLDTNGNGEADPDEANFGNRYNQWTPSLLRAAYNYQYIAKDPGLFAHNADYGMQVMYDSIVALGGEDAAAGLLRPEVDFYE
jgi:hypothetical protein